MNDFLKNKLNDYDDGFDQSAWDSIQELVKENNSGNDSLKDNLKGFDAGYNQNAWSNIAAKVAQNNLAYKSSLLYKRMAGAAIFIGVLITGMVSFSSLNNDSEKQIADLNNDNISKQEKASFIPNEKTEIIDSKKTVSDSKEGLELLNKPSVDKTIETKEPNHESNKLTRLNTPTIDKQFQLPKLILEKKELCLGEELSAKIINNSNINYKVKIDGNWLKNEKLNSYRFTKPGQHVIELYEKNAKNKLNSIARTSVLVFNGTNSNFNYNKRNSAINQQTQFAVVDKSLSQTLWYVENQLVGSESTINYTFNNKGKYSVKMVACNANGCKDSSTQTVRILKAYNLLATQVFNPEKEKWLPLGLKENDQTFELKIVSSEGKQVFYSENNTKEWNGIVEESGKKVNDGDEFYWVAKVKNSNGNIHEYGGSFIVSSSLP